jgi:YD repeat-containing protein
MVDGVGTTYYSYDAMGLLVSEDGPWANDVVSYSNMANKLRGQMQLQQPNASSWVRGYGYDAANRLTSVTSPAGVFGYNYIAVGQGASPANLVGKLTLPNGSWIANTYDAMGRQTGTWLNTSSGTTLNAHQYIYNAGNQRSRMTQTLGNYQDYTYDAVGQLKSASGKEPGGSARLQEQLGYAYDRAGNLGYRTNNALVQTVNTDNLNQLTTITRSGTTTVSGTTGGAATSVKVNGQTATCYGDSSFALAGVALSDGVNSFTAVAQDSYGRHDTNTVTVNLPATVNFQYDANGNLSSDGARTFDYDDENQLIRVTAAGAWKSEFSYDGQGRLRVRKEYAWQAGA